MNPAKIASIAQNEAKSLEQVGIKVKFVDGFVLSIENFTQGKPLLITAQQAEALAEKLPAIVAGMKVL